MGFGNGFLSGCLCMLSHLGTDEREGFGLRALSRGLVFLEPGDVHLEVSFEASAL